LPNLDGKPIVLVITNNTIAWPEFRKELGDSVDIRAPHRDPYEAWNRAHKDGCLPDIIAIGCIAEGTGRTRQPYAGFIKDMRRPEPGGPGFTGPIIGLCEQCSRIHIKEGCDEVSEFGTHAAKRILELIEEKGIGKN
jgi:hypothetical protein